jgi:hypothetical protein
MWTLISFRCFKGCVERATVIKIMQLFIVRLKRYAKLSVASNELNGYNEDKAVLCDGKKRCRCRCRCSHEASFHEAREVANFSSRARATELGDLFDPETRCLRNRRPLAAASSR